MRRKNRTFVEPRTCLGCDRKGTYAVKMRPTVQEIQGEEITFDTEKYHCDACGAEWLSPKQGTDAVHTAVTIFLTKHGMLTGPGCEQRRKNLGWTQQDLADAAKVGIATIKRLESGVHILTHPNNDATDQALQAGERSQSFKTSLALSWDHAKLSWPGSADWSIEPDLQSSETVLADSEAMALAANSNELALAA